MRKYLKNGQEVHVYTKLRSGYLVQNILQCSSDGGNELLDDLIYFIPESDLFDSAPNLKFNSIVEDLKKEIYDLTERKNKIQTALNKEQKAYIKLINKLKKHEALKNIENFLEGKITHLVCIDFDTFEIKEIKSGTESVKLISLFGKSNGKLDWRINQYTDGSGFWSSVFMCSSYEDALATLQKFLLEKEAKLTPTKSVIECAEKYDLELPESYINKWKTILKESRNREKAELLRKLEKLNEED